MSDRKCPLCGSENFGKLMPTQGTSFVITSVDASVNPPLFNPTNGMPVDLYVCADCKCVIPYNDSIRKR